MNGVVPQLGPEEKLNYLQVVIASLQQPFLPHVDMDSLDQKLIRIMNRLKTKSAQDVVTAITAEHAYARKTIPALQKSLAEATQRVSTCLADATQQLETVLQAFAVR
jgi:hypothetical protein